VIALIDEFQKSEVFWFVDTVILLGYFEKRSPRMSIPSSIIAILANGLECPAVAGYYGADRIDAFEKV